MITQVPTNVITGFLGVGKTTAIMHLMQSKPEAERWAVLVNEFGEVGIDGSLFEGLQASSSRIRKEGIYIREVPGGCMCCTAGLPMQVALNRLLETARPHRLLIEPTGLGHPKEVLATLNSEHYQDVLNLQRTITLIDARKLADSRYTEHDTFLQQLDIADIIVANKSDLYSAGDYDKLNEFLAARFPIEPSSASALSKPESRQSSKPLQTVVNGQLCLDWLQGPASFQLESDHHHHHHSSDDNDALKSMAPGEVVFPDSGFVSVRNQGEGFVSQGWVFKPELAFNKPKLNDLFMASKVERLKAMCLTDEGVFAFNRNDDEFNILRLDDARDSRIELIASHPDQLLGFEEKLIACLVRETTFY